MSAEEDGCSWVSNAKFFPRKQVFFEGVKQTLFFFLPFIVQALFFLMSAEGVGCPVPPGYPGPSSFQGNRFL